MRCDIQLHGTLEPKTISYGGGEVDRAAKSDLGGCSSLKRKDFAVAPILPLWASPRTACGRSDCRSRLHPIRLSELVLTSYILDDNTVLPTSTLHPHPSTPDLPTRAPIPSHSPRPTPSQRRQRHNPLGPLRNTPLQTIPPPPTSLHHLPTSLKLPQTRHKPTLHTRQIPKLRRQFPRTAYPPRHLQA